MLVLPATAETIAGFIAAAEAARRSCRPSPTSCRARRCRSCPRTQHGKLVIMAMLAYAGDGEAGERALAPFRALASRSPTWSSRCPTPRSTRPRTEELPPDWRRRARCSSTTSTATRPNDGRPPARPPTRPMRVVQLRVLGGAMARVPADATAFAHRASRIMVNVAAFYEAPPTRPRPRGLGRRVRRGAPPGRARRLRQLPRRRRRGAVREAYPGSTWDRLAAVKARYDPTNLFHRNQNIPPATKAVPDDQGDPRAGG